MIEEETQDSMYTLVVVTVLSVFLSSDIMIEVVVSISFVNDIGIVELCLLTFELD